MILVVDDDPGALVLLEMVLRQHGKFAVARARSGKEALRLLQRQDFPCDLVISDIRMPNMDGRELLFQMRADPNLAYIPVIMCTSNADKATVVDLIGQGVRDYIVKPISPATLLAKVKAVVADQGPVIEPREATMRRLAIGNLDYVPLAQSTVSVLDAVLTDLAAALRIAHARAARTSAAKAVEPAERFGAAGTIDLANKAAQAPDDLEALRLAGALLTAVGRLRNTLHNVGLIRRNGEGGAVS